MCLVLLVQGTDYDVQNMSIKITKKALNCGQKITRISSKDVRERWSREKYSICFLRF